MKVTNTTVMIDQVSNGYILILLSEDGEELSKAIASSNNIRGYSHDNLATAIENLFEKAQELVAEKTPKIVSKSEEVGPDNKTFRELIDEVDINYIKGVDHDAT